MNLVQNERILFACFISYYFGQEKVVCGGRGDSKWTPKLGYYCHLVWCAITQRGEKRVSKRQFYLRLQRFWGRKEHDSEEIATKVVPSPCDNSFAAKAFISVVKQCKGVYFFQQDGKTMGNSKSKFFMRRHIPTVKVVKQQAWFIQERNVPYPRKTVQILLCPELSVRVVTFAHG